VPLLDSLALWASREADLPWRGHGKPTGRDLDPFFAAVVEAIKEAVLNSLLARPTMTGQGRHRFRGPREPLAWPFESRWLGLLLRASEG
jgi:hypothetical protein